jgi:hypothetical protein
MTMTCVESAGRLVCLLLSLLFIGPAGGHWQTGGTGSLLQATPPVAGRPGPIAATQKQACLQLRANRQVGALPTLEHPGSLALHHTAL